MALYAGIFISVVLFILKAVLVFSPICGAVYCWEEFKESYRGRDAIILLILVILLWIVFFTNIAFAVVWAKDVYEHTKAVKEGF